MSLGEIAFTSASNALAWVWNGLSGFFLIEVTAKRAAWYRIIFGVVLLAIVLLTAHNPAEFFTDQGAFPLSLQRPYAGEGAVSLFYYITDPSLTVVLYWVLIGSIVSYILGFYPRVMLVIAWILWLSFMQRTPFITNGSDRVLRALVLPLLFLDTSRALVPRFLQPYAPKQEPDTVVAGWPVRLMQIQVALVYGATALIKWPYIDWQDGSYLFQLLNNPNYSLVDGYWLQHWPLLVNLATYFAIFGEILAPFFLFTARTRKVMLLWLFALHAGILALSNVVLFSWVMFAALSLFFTNAELEKASRFLTTLRERRWLRTMSAYVRRSRLTVGR